LINFNFQDGITFFRDFVWFEEDWKRLNSQQLKISLNPHRGGLIKQDFNEMMLLFSLYSNS